MSPVPGWLVDITVFVGIYGSGALLGWSLGNRTEHATIHVERVSFVYRSDVERNSEEDNQRVADWAHWRLAMLREENPHLSFNQRCAILQREMQEQKD